MRIFLDSANIAEIERWLQAGVIDGVTTNPTIMLNDGVYDLERGVKSIARLIAPRPLSVEVYTNDLEGMLSQAHTFAGWAPNVVVKIPVLNQEGTPCLEVVRVLSEEQIPINVTACLSFGQVALATKAGARYISIFAGRVADEGHDAPRLIQMAVQWLERWKYTAEVIVGSLREAIQVQEAALAGAHVLTVPPRVLARWLDHKYTRETVRGFTEDAQKALERMRAASEGSIPRG